MAVNALMCHLLICNNGTRARTDEIDRDFVEGFLGYLRTAKSLKDGTSTLSPHTQRHYQVAALMATPSCNTFLVADSTAAPMWARFYDLRDCQPFVCDRDGIPRRHLEDIGQERRSGYKWYDTEPGQLYTLYNIWADRWDKAHKLDLQLGSPGANERGLVVMDIPLPPVAPPTPAASETFSQ